MSSSEFRHVVRLGGRDLNGKKKVLAALADIKGIGFSTANAVLNKLNIDANVRLGSLSENDLNRIDDYVRNLQSKVELSYLLNRRKDPSSGSNIHLIGSDLDFVVKDDIRREKDVMSWRGIRHSLGLKVRGQRTRTTGRKGLTVGVRKGVARPGQVGQPASAEEAKK
ncbi:MAG: 30S ribosomal protein S13 [Nitrososphaeria archaeon]